MIDKGRFDSSAEYHAALAESKFAGLAPLSPKLAGSCMEAKPGAAPLAVSSEVLGPCELDAEGCTRIYDKIKGLEGFCLRNTVGVDETGVSEVTVNVFSRPTDLQFISPPLSNE